jgi:RNA polymerase sigma-70 factor (ECF subfamily)
MDDEALLERARHGDRDAFAAIVTRHQDELYTMALRITGTPADAADVVQETFLRAYVRIPILRGQTIRAWLFRVAINCSHDVQRRTIRRPADPLHPDFRAAVVLRDVNDLSYEEMSAALRIPIGTVKSRLNRGRSMLAKALRGSAAFPGFAEEHA